MPDLAINGSSDRFQDVSLAVTVSFLLRSSTFQDVRHRMFPSWQAYS